MEKNIIGLNTDITKGWKKENKCGKLIYSYECRARAVYGLGERYCSVNHKGRTIVNKVFEQFTQQNENTYLPLPFFHTSDGHGVFVRTAYEVTFRFAETVNYMEIDEDAVFDIYFFYGSPLEIVAKFNRLTGKTILPPKWAFGVWASANRWNNQKQIEEQMELIQKYHYPVSVIVIEAWSDEATFYIWNGAEYLPKAGSKSFQLADFEFHRPWNDPVKMIHDIHRAGMKLILWQIPALKLLDEGQENIQHDNDCEYAGREELAVQNPDGTPYKIPRQWFIGSMVPDFSNPETCKWWADKRQYLLSEMGVDGFKTDGGEFIHELKTKFYDGREGREARNLYPAQYEKVYQEMIGKDRVLFSRSGYIGAQTTPMHWAGDQLSLFSELRSVLNAGLSLSLCGVPFWSFDIAGFAGPLPDKELYLRATALGAFTPAMQWHSEPADGQFAEILGGHGGTNDRSPWNMAEVTGDMSILETAVFFANLHTNFLPHIFCEAIKASKNGYPLMKHLFFEYSKDSKAASCDDEYMIGDLLIAPVLEEKSTMRSVYLPKGNWFDLWTGEKIIGQNSINVEVPLNRIPVYLRENGAVALNLNDCLQLGSYVGNQTESYDHLCIVYAGENAEYQFYDNILSSISLKASRITESNVAVQLFNIQEITEKMKD